MKEKFLYLRRNKKKLLIYVLSCLVITFCLTVVPLYLWLTSGLMNIGITSIRGDSMLPNFSNGQILYVDELSFNRGDIVVVKVTNSGKYNEDGTSLLKRIVGLPGETIEIVKDGVLIDGNLLDESAYTNSQNKTLQDSNDIQEIVLSDHEYFIIGDNRDNSFDSRHIGAVHSKDFLYSLTTEPNDYTMKILSTAIVVVMLNITMIVFLCLVLLYMMTSAESKKNAKNTKSKKKKQYNKKKQKR